MLVRPGFGVQVGVTGQMTSPGRVTTKAVDTVIDAVTVRAVTTPEVLPPAVDSMDQTVVEVAAADPGGVALPDSEPLVKPDDISAFDQIVMRSFGMINDGKPDAETVDDKGDAVTQLQPAMLLGETAEDGPTEEDKTGTGKESDTDAADGKTIAEKTIAEEENRYAKKVDEAARGSDGSSDSSSESDSDSNAAPQLASISGFSFTDTSADDSFSDQTGTLTGSDSDSGDTLTYAISGQSANTSQSGYTHAASGSYGTLYINSSSGAYKYIPTDSAVEGATSSQTDSFTLSLSDGTATATQSLTATIGGVNDTPVLAALSGISFTDTSGDDSFSVSTATASGSDRDSGDTLTYGVMGGSADTSRSGFTHSYAGTYGTLYVNSATGAYEYVPNDSAIEALASQVSESFDLAVTDGTTLVRETLVATITGVNDTPEIAALSAISVTDTTSYDSFSASTGTISTTERDSGQTLSIYLTGSTSAASDADYSVQQSGDYGVLEFNNLSLIHISEPTRPY